MKNFSIKWKLSLALILSGLGLVALYVTVAKRVFENDKISYVYDSQAAKLSSLKKEIEAKFSSALLVSRSVILSYDPNIGGLTATGKQIFQSEKSFAALELWDELNNKPVFRIENQQGLLPPNQTTEESLPWQTLDVSPLGAQKFLLIWRYSIGDETKGLRLRSVIEIENMLPEADSAQMFLLVSQGRVIAQSHAEPKYKDLFARVASDVSQDELERTSMVENKKEKYLMSSVNFDSAQFKLIALTPEAEALGALSTLFHRSIIFMFFSAFALVIISLFIARKMTYHLFLLTKSAIQIGQGIFDSVPIVRSRDEMGVLSMAFNKMCSEIKRLLLETKDKARMEAELKTAHIVQESLLPSQAAFSLNQIEINGLVVTSTECGGDWWHYFVKDKEIYVAIADATGHGTPAALITAAARSVFSRLENEDLSLVGMMKAWDNAISSCSKNKIFMTGILLKIDTETGFCQYISAGHESPFLFTPELDQYQFSFLDLEVHNSLGEGFKSDPKMQHFNLPQGASLILYTDGLFAVENNNGRKLSEKRLGKKLAEQAGQLTSAKRFSEQILQEFNEHRNGAMMPDDISIVAIRRN